MWLTTHAIGESEYGPDRFVLKTFPGEPGTVPLGFTDAATTWELRHLVHPVGANFSYAGPGELRGGLGCAVASSSNPVTTLDLRAFVLYHGNVWRQADVKLDFVCSADVTPFSIPLDLTGVALAAGEVLEVGVMTTIPNPSYGGLGNLYLTVAGQNPTVLEAPWTDQQWLEPMIVEREWSVRQPIAEQFLWATDAGATTVIVEGEATRGLITVKILDPESGKALETLEVDHRGMASDAPAKPFRQGAILDAGERTRWLIELDLGDVSSGSLDLSLLPLLPPGKSTTVAPQPAPKAPVVEAPVGESPQVDEREPPTQDTPWPGTAMAALVLAFAVMWARRP